MAKPSPDKLCFVPFTKEDVEQSLPARFRKVARTFIGETAVVSGDQCLSYAGLDKASNQVARAIVDAIGPGDQPVPLVLEQGLSPIVALWGVLKAGKGYVALRPSDPPERLRAILKDLQAPRVLTNHKNSQLVASIVPEDCKPLNLDETTQFPTGAIDVPVDPDSLAAIFYTSGSTGEPKGVVHTHRSLLHMAWRDSHYYQLGTADHYFDPFACGFIASAIALFDALLNGATLHIYNAQEIPSLRLVELIVHDHITVLHPTVSLLRQFLDTLDSNPELSQSDWRVRLLALSGENVYGQDVERFIRAVPVDTLVLHRFSCTETGPVTYWEVDPATLGADVLPAGFATPETEIVLLDEAGGSVGAGQVGEIAIKSRYLAAGYWQRPDLTRANFLDGAEGSNQRLYLTGDLGRQKPDGCLEHLGRKDFQAKVRGFTVAPSVIEGTLHGLEEIKEALVIAEKDQGGETRLIAYIVPSERAAPTVGKLRRALALSLPDYMIPSAFISLARLPLTATGKIDRRSLPALGSVRPHLDTSFVAPATVTEERLAGLWSDVLGVQQLGVCDNFFELGGHSLLAIRVLSRVRETFALDVSLEILFETPTIAGLAAVIDTIQWATKTPEADHTTGDDDIEDATF